MRRMTGIKRALSITLTLTLLLSMMTVAGVSVLAAGDPLHSANYNTQAEQDYYATGANRNDHYTNGQYGLALSQASGGHTAGDGTDGCMALTGASTSGSFYVGYRFTSGTASKVALTTGTNYRVTLWYKVTAFGVEKKFGVANQSKAWGSSQVSLTLLDSITITAADVAKGWQQATFTFTGAANNGLHIAMLAGTGNTVLVDDVQVYEQTASTSTLTFRDTDIAPLTGNAGDTIAYPAAPTRDGYIFMGWYTESGDPAPIVFPESDLTLVARWETVTAPAADVWSFETEAVDTLLSVGTHSVRKAVVTAEESKSGSRSLKLTGNDKSGYARPQVMIKDHSGAQVTVEAGKKYEISYWIKVPTAAGTTQINWWLTASADDAYYDNSNAVNADTIYTQNNMDVTADAWQQVTVTIDNCAKSGKLRLGISGNRFGAHDFYIDDIRVKEIVPFTPTAGVWSFETEAADTRLSLGTHDVRKAVVTADEFKSGAQSLKLTGNDKAGYARPQVMIKDHTGAQVTVREGVSYEISFWLKVPAAAGTTSMNWWLTASADDTYYDNSNAVNPDKIYDQNDMAVTADEWQQVTVTLIASKSGKLRLGISGNRFGAHDFYIDDFSVKTVIPPAASEGTLTFENEALDTNLALNNSDVNRIVVTDEIPAKSGTQAARVTSNDRAGNTRPQMLVKDDNGDQIHIFKGRSYEISFSVFIPEGSEKYGFNYWFAAANNEQRFDSNNPKDQYVLAEVTAGSQPTPGEWVTLTLAVTDAPVGGKLRLGVTGNTTTRHSFYIDDITVRMTDPAAAPSDMQGFEDYAPDDTLSLNTDAASITVSAEDVHTGFNAAKVVTLGNAVNTAPQMPLNDYQGEPMTVKEGMKYQLSFYAMVPYGTQYDLQCWLTVADNDTPYSEENPRTNVVLDTTVVQATDRGGWQFVTLTIVDCAASGALRLGICGSTDEAHTLYIDDMMFRERSPLPGDPEAMNFERYTNGQQIQLNTGSSNVVTVTDEYSHTGSNAVAVESHDHSGDYRPQFNLTDADGNYLTVEKGEDCYITLMVRVPRLVHGCTAVNYWLACVPEDQADRTFNNSTFTKNDHVLYESRISADDLLLFDDWQKLTIPVLNSHLDGVLRLGVTQNDSDLSTTDLVYIDDIKKEAPRYVVIKFDTNGSEDEIEDIVMLEGSLIPFVGGDPYLDGSDFMGWYTGKEFKKDQYFDIYEDTVTAEHAPVLTLYARWRKWDDGAADVVKREDEEEFVTEYYTEKVWVGDQNVPDPWDTGDRLTREDAEPIVTTPDDVKPDDSGIPPWLIVVIIVGAVVVVGGGAAIAAVMFKKNKKA